MKYLILIISLTVSTWAAAIDWPAGPAPCNGTLQACVDGSPAYTNIFINTNTPIDESIVTSNPVSLIAGNGFKPTFASGRQIEMTNSPTSFRTVTIEGLTFIKGRIAYHLLGGTADSNLNIRRNTILDNSSALQGIRILNSSNQTLNINVDYNQVTFTGTTGTSDTRGAIAIRSGTSTGSTLSGTIAGRLYGNTLSSNGPASIGAGIFAYGQTDVNINIAGNEFTGGVFGGVYTFRSNGNGETDLNIGNNAFYEYSSDELFKGVFAEAETGVIDLDIVNNTTLKAFDGFRFDEQPGAEVDVYLYNNIMAFGDAAVWTDAESNINNDYNLLFSNTSVDPDFSPGPNSMSANPMVVGMQNGRLKAGSPAIESGQTASLFALGSSPLVDADGTHRIKKGNSIGGSQQVDVGAYETGDLYFNHVVNTDTNYISNINNSALDGNATLDDLHITSNWNPIGGGGVYNNDNEGIYYAGGLWRIFNEGITNFITGATFNVHKYASTSSTFEHNVTASGDNTTQLNNSTLNDFSDRILQVTQHWTGTYNPNPPSVYYFSGFWYIINGNLENIPSGSNYNVYSQPPSKSAWRHMAAAANTSGHITYLDNPLINDVHCAEIQVTQSADGGEFNDAPIGVYYDFGQWSVFNQDFSDMVEDSTFHITANPEQIAACSDVIFDDGFE